MSKQATKVRSTEEQRKAEEVARNMQREYEWKKKQIEVNKVKK
jgi:hypothetical protein